MIYFSKKRMMQRLLACVLLVGVISKAAADPPNLYWAMDKIEANTLNPNIGNQSYWSANLSPITGSRVATGVDGHALILDQTQISVGYTSKIKQTCLFLPQNCEGGGLTIAMWIKVQKWTNLIASFFWTGGEIYNYPGVTIYPDLHDHASMSVTVLLANKDKYVAGISRDLIGTNTWAHFTTTWSESGGIRIYVNGTEATYTRMPSSSTSSVMGGSFRISMNLGKPEVSFYLDELKVWYRPLSPDEVTQAMQTGGGSVGTISTESPTTAVASTTTSTTTPAAATTTLAVTTATAATTTVLPTTTAAPTTLEATTVTTASTSAATTTLATDAASTASTEQTSSTPVSTTVTTTVKTTTREPPPINPPVVVPTTRTTTTTAAATSTTISIAESTEAAPQDFWTTETIIAVSVGASVAFLALVIACCVCCCLAAKRREKEEENEEQPRSRPVRV